MQQEGDLTNVISVIGPKGVGKSTALRRLMQEFPKSGDTAMLNFAELMRGISRERLGVDFFDLDADRKVEMRREGALAVSRMGKRTVVIDGHYIDLIEGSPVSLVEENLKGIITAHIVVETDAQTILHRRLSDKTGKVRETDLERVKRELECEEDAACALGRETGTPVYIVHAGTASVEQVASLLRSVIMVETE